jgi:ACR3 family arsenite transporter
MAILNTWLVSILLVSTLHCHGCSLEWSCWWKSRICRIDCLKQYFQVLLYSVCIYFHYRTPPYFGYTGFDVNISIGQIAESVGIYLEFHFALGIISRYALIHLKAKTGSRMSLLSHPLPLSLYYLQLWLCLAWKENWLFKFDGCSSNRNSSCYLLHFDVCVELHGREVLWRRLF